MTEDGHETHVGPNEVLVERGGRSVAAVTSAHGVDTEFHAVLGEAAPELDNAGLRAAIAVQLEEVRASRERIAEAQVDERRRIERDLHDGAQQRLPVPRRRCRRLCSTGSPERLRTARSSECANHAAQSPNCAVWPTACTPPCSRTGGLGAALEDLSTRAPVTVVWANSGAAFPR